MRGQEPDRIVHQLQLHAVCQSVAPGIGSFLVIVWRSIRVERYNGRA